MSVLNKTRQFLYSLGAVFLSLFFCLNVISTPVFAEPTTNQTQTQDQTTSETTSETQSQDQAAAQKQTADESGESTNTCYDESGSLGWLVCPTTGFLARITDGLYDIIQQMLVVKPLTTDSDSPFHQIWSIFRDITNVVFAIFFLVIIFSQVSGIGISNYGVKKLLPKIIISAILINLSYIICAALVDVSNIVGSSLKGLFTGIEEGITATGIIANAAEGTQIDFSNIVSGLIGGGLIAGLAIGATGGLGAIFISLLPVLLAAVFAVAIAYITIAARQAFVYLLIMVSPLAFVCNLLPNTEKWFATWKKSLSQMLLFYPMFAALFGACSLVGWTIIAAAEDTLILIMGIAVKVVPLIACWSLLKMSGTLPGQISSALTKLSSHPVNALRSYTNEATALRRAKYLGEKPRAWQYGRKFGQNLQDRKFRTAADTAAYLEAAKNRGAAYASNYKNGRGRVSNRGRSMQALIEQNIRNKQLAAKSANDYEKGLSSQIDPNSRQYNNVLAQDLRNRDAADDFNVEAARGEMIARDNAESRHERFEAALTAHSQSSLYGRDVDQVALQHYNRIKGIMDGDTEYTQYAGAYAANAHAVQDKIIDGKFMNYFDYIPATQEVVNRLKDLTNAHKSNQYIDSIVMGMRTLSLRGDTDLIKETIDDVLKDGQIQLGTHASQALSNFCMFDVKDKDPLLRRYGKFINLETARAFNETPKGIPSRLNRTLSFNEYITGEYQEYNRITDAWETKRVKRDAVVLMEGTSLDGVERTAYANLDASLRKAYTNSDTGEVDYDGLIKRRGQIYNSILPAFISAALKYPSGSEQIQNQASWLTGYKLKDGKWVQRWDDPEDVLFGIPESHFKSQSDIFIQAQTSGQILNIRTDLILPLTESLADERIAELIKEGKLTEDWDEEFKPKESDKPEDVEQKEKAKIAKRKELAGEKLRNLLDAKGNLELIYKSKRSGAALNSKPQFRDMLLLNDDAYIATYNAKKAAERKERLAKLKEKLKAEGHDVEVDDAPKSPTYDNHEFFNDIIQEFYDSCTTDDEFYTGAMKKLRKFGLKNIAEKLKEHHDADPDIDASELLLVLGDLLNDPENYV